MKKIKKFLKSNIKLFIGLIIGFVISGSIVSAAILFASDEVSYDNTTSGIQATNVQDAIDELYTIANRKIISDGVTNVGFQTNTTNTVFANSNGLCIVRKGKLSCFKINNYAEEQNHIQQVFSDVECSAWSGGESCAASDFYCDVYSSGNLRCFDISDFSYCYVYSNGSVDCR